MRKWVVLLILLLLPFNLTYAQGDGIDLPTEWYILLNSGTVERYGLGTTGVVTVTPPDEYVVDFGIAADGNWIAYRTEAGLYLGDLSNAADVPYLLEGVTADVPPLRQDAGQTIVWGDDTLAYTTIYGVRVAFDIASGTPHFTDIPTSSVKHLSWSPDGNFLAAEVENNIWWIYRRNGYQMDLAGALPSSFGTSWLDEGLLVFAPAEGGLYVLDLLNANRQSALIESSQIYSQPYVREDGAILVFVHDPADETIGETGAFIQQITPNARGVYEISETSANSVDITGLKWAPRGELLIAFREGGLNLVVNTAEGTFFVDIPIDEVVAYGWGALRPAPVRGTDLADGYFRAPDPFGVMQVWQLGGDAPTLLTQAITDVTGYAVHNNQLVYASGGGLWSQSLTETEAVEFAKVNNTASDLSFSADGSSLVFATSNVVSGGVYQVSAVVQTDANGETQLNPPELIIANTDGVDYGEPSFAPNINALLVRVGTNYAMYDIVSGELLDLGAYDEMHWLDDGRLLAIYAEGVSIVDPVTLAVIPVYSAQNERILAASMIASGRVGVLVQPIVAAGPAAVALIDVPLAGGAPQMIAEPGYMINPILSDNVIIGLTRAGGHIMIVDITTGEQIILRAPLGAGDYYTIP